ncbi:hypothetical protein H634G_07604 [Metarhizium anisopliae BRIP 53293]|uniref:Uncharacterized protein n=5 Tax=Metarhizium TaxID=5529 RepID=A0A0D9NTF8_METAN|nr:hypothetical protein H634G_07604 [Metarhizium anisopliae BRIP 53293]KJK85604.1 hypothetical protein H633G_10556 [Metarhizium anisopliae BRIP 53284]
MTNPLLSKGKKQRIVHYSPPANNTTNMPHVASPVTMSSQRNDLRLFTSQDLYSLNANLSYKGNRPSTPVRRIQENDYTVPAPPPPSPVSFRADKWSMPSRK